MKERCQCGKPKAFYRGEGQGTICSLSKPSDLHFKAADRYCERCGVALCGECTYFATMADYLCDTNYLCHTCAELEME